MAALEGKQTESKYSSEEPGDGTGGKNTEKKKSFNAVDYRRRGEAKRLEQGGHTKKGGAQPELRE